MISLKNKVALITGASRGIGKETALLFARAGANVVVDYYKNEKEAEKVVDRARKYKVKAFSFQSDVGSYNDLRKLFDFTMGKFKRIDILVNNAGIWEYAKINEIKPTELRRTLKVNLEGVFHLTQMVSAVMIKQKLGNIINISSTAGQRGEPFQLPLCCLQRGDHQFNQVLGSRIGSIQYQGQLRCPGMGGYRYEPKTFERREGRDFESYPDEKGGKA